MSIHVSRPTGQSDIRFSYEFYDHARSDLSPDLTSPPLQYWHVFDLYRTKSGGLVLEIHLRKDGAPYHTAASECANMSEVSGAMRAYLPSVALSDLSKAEQALLCQRYAWRSESFLTVATKRFRPPLHHELTVRTTAG